MTNSRLQTASIFIILFSIFWGGCYYDNAIPIAEDEITQELSFTNDIQPIFNKDCNVSGCHSSGGQRPDLSSALSFVSLTTGNYINTANPDKSVIYEWMKGFNTLPMPTTGSVPDYNAKILAWIKQGAKNN